GLMPSYRHQFSQVESRLVLQEGKELRRILVRPAGASTAGAGRTGEDLPVDGRHGIESLPAVWSARITAVAQADGFDRAVASHEWDHRAEIEKECRTVLEDDLTVGEIRHERRPCRDSDGVRHGQPPHVELEDPGGQPSFEVEEDALGI